MNIYNLRPAEREIARLCGRVQVTETRRKGRLQASPLSSGKGERRVVCEWGRGGGEKERGGRKGKERCSPQGSIMMLSQNNHGMAAKRVRQAKILLLLYFWSFCTAVFGCSLPLQVHWSGGPLSLSLSPHQTLPPSFFLPLHAPGRGAGGQGEDWERGTCRGKTKTASAKRTEKRASPVSLGVPPHFWKRSRHLRTCG